MVDLTPLLPGGGNGGAKWFVLALLSEMARQRPDWRWWLLTTEANHRELSHHFPSAGLLRTIDGEGRPIARPDPARLPDGGCANLLYCPFTAPFHAVPAVPTVCTVYDLQFAAYPQFFSKAEVEERAGHFFRAAGEAARLVCISDYVRDHVRRVSGLDGRRVCRIHISLPDRLPSPNPAVSPQVMARLGLVPGRYLLYPANTWPHKNHAMLMTAAGIFFARRPDSDLRLVCTGVSDDGRGAALRDAARLMGLEGRIRFPGFQTEEDLAALIGGARAVIFPSLFEGFGMPVLEAMAQGVPVLSANTTSLPEIAGDAALLFDPRRPEAIVKAIEAIEDDPALADRLAAAGRQRAHALGDAADMAAQYLDVFEDVVRTENNFVGHLRRRLRLMRSHPLWNRSLGVFLIGQLQRVRAGLSRRLPVLRRFARWLLRRPSGS